MLSRLKETGFGFYSSFKSSLSRLQLLQDLPTMQSTPSLKMATPPISGFANAAAPALTTVEVEAQEQEVQDQCQTQAPRIDPRITSGQLAVTPVSVGTPVRPPVRPNASIQQTIQQRGALLPYELPLEQLRLMQTQGMLPLPLQTRYGFDWTPLIVLGFLTAGIVGGGMLLLIGINSTPNNQVIRMAEMNAQIAAEAARNRPSITCISFNCGGLTEMAERQYQQSRQPQYQQSTPPDGYYPDGYYPDGYYPDGYYPDGYYPDQPGGIQEPTTARVGW